jgi:hypothetical protein
MFRPHVSPKDSWTRGVSSDFYFSDREKPAKERHQDEPAQGQNRQAAPRQSGRDEGSQRIAQVQK